MKNLVLSIVFAFISNFFFGQEYDRNEYDYIGKAHNEILSEYYKDKELNDNLSMQEAMDKIFNLTRENSIVKELLDGRTIDFPWGTVENYETVASDYVNNFSNTIGKSALSDKGKEYIFKLLNKIQNGNFNDLENFYKDINKLEDEIIESKIIDVEKVILLGSCSVARHSAFLAYDSSSSYAVSPDSGKGNGWRVVADVVGGVFGGVGTGLSSSATGFALIGLTGVATIAAASAGTGLYDRWFGN